MAFGSSFQGSVGGFEPSRTFGDSVGSIPAQQREQEAELGNESLQYSANLRVAKTRADAYLAAAKAQRKGASKGPLGGILSAVGAGVSLIPGMQPVGIGLSAVGKGLS